MRVEQLPIGLFDRYVVCCDTPCGVRFLCEYRNKNGAFIETNWMMVATAFDVNTAHLLANALNADREGDTQDTPPWRASVLIYASEAYRYDETALFEEEDITEVAAPPAETEDEPGPDDRAIANRIRRLAKQSRLSAKKVRRDHLWYFADDRNMLQSPERGLDDAEALAYLTQDGGGQ